MIGRSLLLAAALSVLFVASPASAHHDDQAPWLICLVHPVCDPGTNPAVDETFDYAGDMAGMARCMIKYPFLCDPMMMGRTLDYVDEML